jgi:hypothetical protein
MLHGTLAALAGDFKPMILVNPRGALGLDAERANQGQSFDQLWKIARRSCINSFRKTLNGLSASTMLAEIWALFLKIRSVDLFSGTSIISPNSWKPQMPSS